jgi:L-malate glycosyltransferase
MKTMTIGVCGPIDLNLLDWDLKRDDLPTTNSFPLTSHFINALLKRGYKVIGYTSSGNIDEPMVLESGNLKICISRHKPQPGRRFFKFEVEDLHKIIEANPADIISSFWTYEYSLAPLRTDIPTVVNLHDVASKILLKQPDMFRLIRWIMNFMVLRKAKHVVANSAYTYSLLGMSTKVKARTINNFYTKELEDQSIPLAAKGNYIVSAIQGFTKRKNVHGALHAFAKLRSRFPDLEYHLVGVDMEENGPAHEYARNLHLDKGVKFIGCLPFEKVSKEIAGARVLLHPSMEESFGMAILEAMVTGTAVVGGKKSGYVPHLLNYGKAGLLCDITSHDEMASSVAKLLTDKSLMEEIVRNAKTFAHSNYSEDVVIEKHLAFFSDVLGVQQKVSSPVSQKEPVALQYQQDNQLRAS